MKWQACLAAAAFQLTVWPQALTRFSGSDVVGSWFDGDFRDIYHAHKKGELAYLEDLPPQQRYEAYEAVY